MKKWIGGWMMLFAALSAVAVAQPQDPNEQVREVVAEYQDDAEGAYGLEFRESVEGCAQTREEFGEYLRRKSEEQMPPEKIRGTQVLLVRFGLVPEDFDLVAALQELFGAMAMGYYDPEDNTIRVLTPIPDASLMQETMTHELIHALQDQHFDLGSLIQNAMREDNDDKTAALRFLWEGEATLFTMFAVAPGPRGQLGMVLEGMRRITPGMYAMGLRMKAAEGGDMAQTFREAAEAIERMPPVLFRMATDPYFLGSYALFQVHQQGGIDGIRALWRNPPQSTRDILHPEFLTREQGAPAPRRVQLGALGETLGTGWTNPLSGILGAWTLAVIFDGLGRSLDTITRGWRGDAYQVWQRGDDDFVAGYLAFDAEGDATAFADALEARYRDHLVSGRDVARARTPDALILDADGFLLAIQRRGANVAYALGSGFDPLRVVEALAASQVTEPEPVEHR